uniref:hypothetical protein n=1 Tax=Salinimicrobium sp. HB62 TaxID=3077781 RepID=UPI002D77485F
VRAENATDSDCYVTDSFVLTVYDVPDIVTQGLDACEIGETGKADFTLTSGLTTTEGTVTFYNSQTNADAGGEEGKLSSPYNAADNTTVYVRAENATDSDCYVTDSFVLTVYDVPDIVTQGLDACEIGETGKADFTLTSGLTTTEGTVTFYNSQTNADAGGEEGKLSSPYNAADNTTVYVRAENATDSDCYVTDSFVLTVYDVPDIVTQGLDACEIGETGKADFTLTSGLTTTEGTVTFYNSQTNADAGGEEGKLSSPYNAADNTTVYVRAENATDSDCYVTDSFVLTVYDVPDIVTQGLDACEIGETGKADFTLTSGLTTTEGTVTFYNSQTNADAGGEEGKLSSPYNAADNTTVYVRAENATDSDCYVTDSFVLTVYDVPDIVTQGLDACEIGETGKADFTLTSGLTTTEGTVTFYNSQTNADAGGEEGKLSSPYNAADNTTVYVRAENATDSDCYVTDSFVLTVFDNPDITATYPNTCVGETIDLNQIAETETDFGIYNPDGATLTFYSDWDYESSTGVELTEGSVVYPVVGDNTYYIKAVSTFGEGEDEIACSSITEVTVVGINCLVCETTFAKAPEATDPGPNSPYVPYENLSPECFIDSGLDSERWGWTNKFDVSRVDSGTYYLNLYEAAGQCDTHKGNYVGQVRIEYDGSEIDVYYEIEETHVLKSAHLYVGECQYPTNKKGDITVAPGQYPWTSGALDNSTGYSVHDIGVGDVFYVIAHADVCSSSNGNLDYIAELRSQSTLQTYQVKGKNSTLQAVQCKTSNDRGKNKTASAESITVQSSEIIEEPAVETDVALYPVPFKEVINIDYLFDYTSDVKIEVFDLRGNHLRSYTDFQVTRGSTTTFNIDFALKANQMYVVQVITEREKFVKQIVSSKK